MSCKCELTKEQIRELNTLREKINRYIDTLDDNDDKRETLRAQVKIIENLIEGPQINKLIENVKNSFNFSARLTEILLMDSGCGGVEAENEDDDVDDVAGFYKIL